MKYEKKYYKNLDLIRLLACIAVLLYHLNILKGGYLFVCTFLVLSGYLSCVSVFRKEKFSLKSYYFNRLLHIYLPLIIVVFISISIISFIPSINWLNLKPETTSVLLGYNNFWQLSANLDYFARHVNSPFMHLWYISILLQFDLIFPLIFISLKKVGDKVSKLIPCILTFILALIGSIYFYKVSLNENIMIVYYNTFTRVFSLIFGLFLGFVHSYYGKLIYKKLNTSINKIMFYFYLIVLICLSIFIDAKSVYFQTAMIATTIISCRLIDFGTINSKEDLSIFDKVIKFLSSISYEIYLVQYPVIFLFQNISIKDYFKLPIMIIIIFIISYLIHFSISFKKKNKVKFIKYTVLTIFIIGSLYGTYQYIIAKDYSGEMKQLEEQLSQNEKIMQQKQEEYAAKLKEEEENWNSMLEDLENGESKLKNMVTNLPVVGLGDSVMLGAIESLYKEFPNGYFDAKISRTAWVANEILVSLTNRNMLGDPIILNFGANGDCPEWCKAEIMNTAGDRKVFWINATNDSEVHVNATLEAFAAKYDNLYIIDWNSASRGHYEYFVADGIHLTEVGREAYSKTIYDSIYNAYLEEYNLKKEQIINEHEKSLKSKISFYGNDVLLSAFEDIHDNFTDAKFNINKDFDYEMLEKEIKKGLEDDSISYKIVFAFDNSFNINSNQYQELVKLCEGHEIYIIAMNNQTVSVENANVLNFYDEIKSHSEYVMVDGIHLTDDGNKALTQILIENIK